MKGKRLVSIAVAAVMALTIAVTCAACSGGTKVQYQNERVTIEGFKVQPVQSGSDVPVFAGTVKNTSAYDMRSFVIDVSLYDGSGNYVCKAEGFASNIPAGGSADFSVMAMDDATDDFITMEQAKSVKKFEFSSPLYM